MIRTSLNVELAKARMTQKQLSLLTGIRESTISGYCKDNYKHLVKDHLDKICKALNCDISNILEYIPDDEE
ncbi:TPA: helix-turn-helix domain-containing protein [Clostridium perfringens]|uniref:helix-turn-helix domain-containing protein n=2 Tax=Clostridium perfringens TaxID=1502 RepID=UPI00096A7240|nr:helix-turn-helix transcriptional regulator [Clostridium perfringens]MCX0370538.1 helix-turn-helix transcriptional regulator [Clostridium perfringens]MDM0552373.1 helix-turn-helix transcriptional regulator [Clostridium perfringens]NGT07377.1 helix-turn-helix transcriptional regulator [Clostridium perfringens]NGT58965.1 helix-turn-helix transcriptional regulator [Clostridium perfringens]NGT88026.1 helix-turn-helix transcriptional regulator [Clostridium perfringens]